MEELLEEYILSHIDEEGEYLKRLNRDTHVNLLRPRMLSGHLQGRILKMLCRMIRPDKILELGTFTGYSALCMAEGLNPGGVLHTIEMDDELEDFTRPYLEQSPYKENIRFHIGDAIKSYRLLMKHSIWYSSTRPNATIANIMISYSTKYVREDLF